MGQFKVAIQSSSKESVLAVNVCQCNTHTMARLEFLQHFLLAHCVVGGCREVVNMSLQEWQDQKQLKVTRQIPEKCNQVQVPITMSWPNPGRCVNECAVHNTLYDKVSIKLPTGFNPSNPRKQANNEIRKYRSQLIELEKKRPRTTRKCSLTRSTGGYSIRCPNKC